MTLDNCRVVLVRTRIAANLGAVARVMRNIGLSRLVLVNPEADPGERQARQLSTHGEHILDQAQAVSNLTEAVADCALVAATSARTGGLFRRQSIGAPRTIMPHLAESLAQQRAALVFGPESSGLTNAEIAQCHYLIHIPTAEEYLALNLAQAVAICLYELRLAWLERVAEPLPQLSVAPFAMQERMFADLRTALEQVHFLYGDKADALMHALRHLIGRAGPTEMEVNVMLGLARQLRWFAGHQGECQPPSESECQEPKTAEE